MSKKKYSYIFESEWPEDCRPDAVHLMNSLVHERINFSVEIPEVPAGHYKVIVYSDEKVSKS